MAQVTVNVLASDFEGNDYMNIRRGMSGCPLQRAFIRAGIIEEGTCRYNSLPESVYSVFSPAESMVIKMFNGIIPVEDFSFTVEV